MSFVPPSRPENPPPTAPVPPIAIQVVDQTETAPAEERPQSDRFARNAPPWLVSAIFHMMLLIILGLVAMRNEIVPLLTLSATLGESPGASPIESIDTTNLEPSDGAVTDLAPVELPVVLDPGAAISPTVDPLAPAPPVDPTALGDLLRGREVGRKEALLAAFGGTAETESAVAAGLAWLARNQKRDGSWSLSGPFANGARNDNPLAATALAMLAFQGAGYTHQKPTEHAYNRAVSRGLAVLRKAQGNDGEFFQSPMPYNQRLYTHAICTIVICELYGMTRDDKIRDAAQQAIDYCVRIQSREGGWRYYPNDDSDMSVTGWFVMALASAEMAYLDVPQDTFRRISGFLDQVAIDGGRRYRYRIEGQQQESIALAAEGLLCRQYLGWAQDDPRLVDGTRNLVSAGIDRRQPNVYYWYYATQVCHHMEGESWQKWNGVMRELIPAMQVKEGAERGSWNPQGDAWATAGGRLYVTTLSIYMLEVYYRHLPLYQRSLVLGGF